MSYCTGYIPAACGGLSPLLSHDLIQYRVNAKQFGILGWMRKYFGWVYVLALPMPGLRSERPMNIALWVVVWMSVERFFSGPVATQIWELRFFPRLPHAGRVCLGEVPTYEICVGCVVEAH